MTNQKEQMQSLLTTMGIDLQTVSLTRFDGAIAFRIGSRAAHEPHVIIEKERFIPLFISYRSPYLFSDQLINVQFKSYRKLNEGWFPYEILNLRPEGDGERYVIESLRVNPRIDPSIFSPAAGSLIRGSTQDAPKQETGEEGRLHRILNTFEEKYRSTPD